MKFNNINKFNIKTSLSSFLSFIFYLSRLFRYNKICDKCYGHGLLWHSFGRDGEDGDSALAASTWDELPR